MLRFLASGSKLCDGVSRRELLRVGGLSAAGLSLPQLLTSQTSVANESNKIGSAKPAKSCIVLFLLGGPPQQSTWDPKPDAPDNVRGLIAPIATKLPGVHFGELMPRLSQQADKLAVLRAVSTGDNAHSSSGYYMLTGRPHIPMNNEGANPGAPNDWPNFGSVVQRLSGPRGDLPAAVRLPCHIFNTDNSVWPGQDGGLLGRSLDPWLFRCQPHAPDYRITEFQLPDNMPLDRLAARRDLVRSIDRQQDELAQTSRTQSFGDQQQRAYGLLSSAVSRGAFDLAAENEAMRDLYGRSPFGQSCLLARRLIEADVRLVQVNWYRGPDEPASNPCWDSHSDETNRLRNVLVPPMDQGFAALLTDLSQRGMLDETLIVCMAEFGRTPKINGAGGRDHWGPVFSVAMAGGGIRGGVIHGASDALGGYPRHGLVRPEDLTATMFHCLGYSPEAEFMDNQNRPYAISRGQVIRPIVS